MAKEHIIPITNGKGSKTLVNENYSVTASVNGYDNATIEPSSEEITEGVNEYSFTIAANGTLTLHVSDDGTDQTYIINKRLRMENMAFQMNCKLSRWKLKLIRLK